MTQAQVDGYAGSWLRSAVHPPLFIALAKCEEMSVKDVRCELDCTPMTLMNLYLSGALHVYQTSNPEAWHESGR
jgi:hypothetical protein